MGWVEGKFIEGVACEDAPCCGCCGTNLYGIRQDGPEEPAYCDRCGFNHTGDCPDDSWDDDEEEDEEEETMTINEMLEGLGSSFRKEVN